MKENHKITVYQKENEVVKNNNFIRCSNNLTAIQRKSFAIMLKTAIEVIKESGEQKYYTMPLVEYRKIMGHPESMPTKYIAKELEELMAKIIKWDLKPNGRGVRSVMLAGFEINIHGNTGFLKWEFSNFLIDKILESGYTPLKLSVVLDFDSKYALALYENLQMFRKFKHHSFDLQEFREIMGVEENEHKRMDNFKRKVLNVAINEVNEKSDMKIYCDEIKRGAKIIGFRFSWENLSLEEIQKREKRREKEEMYLKGFKSRIGQKLKFENKKYSITKKGLVYRGKVCFDVIDTYEILSGLKEQGVLDSCLL